MKNNKGRGQRHDDRDAYAREWAAIQELKRLIAEDAERMARTLARVHGVQR